MDPQVFNVIKKMRNLLKDKTSASLTDVEIAMMFGQLDTIIEIFNDPEAFQQEVDGITQPKQPSIIRRIIGGE